MTQTDTAAPPQQTERVIISIDQGTSSTKCIIFKEHANAIVAQHETPCPTYVTEEGICHDPQTIWESVVNTVTKCLDDIKKSQSGLVDIVGVTISNQRETVLLWDSTTGEPLAPAISWQCSRTSNECRALGRDATLSMITGLFIHPYFSAPNIVWLLKHAPPPPPSGDLTNLKVGTVDSWLIWKLTNGQTHATDFTNASRTMLFDIHTLQPSDYCAKFFNIDPHMLPTVFPSSHTFGYTDIGGVLNGQLVPIARVVADQQAALWAHGCRHFGDMEITLGTGGFVMMYCGSTIPEGLDPSKNLLVTLTSDSRPGSPKYAVEGVVPHVGDAIQWLVNSKLVDSVADISRVASSVSHTDGVVIVPSFGDVGYPHWMYGVGTSILGIKTTTQPAHLVRALLMGLAFKLKDVVDNMVAEVQCQHPKCLSVGGQVCLNDELMTILANTLNCQIRRPRFLHMSALGAAQCGDNLASSLLLSEADVFYPDPVEVELYSVEYVKWEKTLRMSLRMCGSPPAVGKSPEGVSEVSTTTDL